MCEVHLRNGRSALGGPEMAKDPVCGMSVDERTAKFTTAYGGKTWYFCSSGCKTTFEKNPTRYAK